MLENIEWHFVQQVLLVSSVLEALLLFSWSFEKYIVAIFFHVCIVILLLYSRVLGEILICTMTCHATQGDVCLLDRGPTSSSTPNTAVFASHVENAHKGMR